MESYGDHDQSSQGGEGTNNINLFTEFLAYEDKVCGDAMSELKARPNHPLGFQDSLKSAKSLVKALKHIRDSTVVRYLLTVMETVLDGKKYICVADVSMRETHSLCLLGPQTVHRKPQLRKIRG